jgi:hypothetical protein
MAQAPGLSGRDWLRGCQPVAAHRFAERGQIGRAARSGGEDLSEVPEVAGSEHAGGCDREELRVDPAAILEPVHLGAPDAHRFAGAELTRRRRSSRCRRPRGRRSSPRTRRGCGGMGTFAVRGYRALEHGDASAESSASTRKSTDIAPRWMVAGQVRARTGSGMASVCLSYDVRSGVPVARGILASPAPCGVPG